MSMEVHQFLNESGGNFTESAPRPPVPGEENELQSNGGTSTRSSGSYKSHISGKSHSSGKSVASHRSDVSLAATPRRSNLDKVGGSLSCSETKLDKDIDAPLGFEPEGSAASSPPFTENSTPPYFKWAEKLKFLLEDSDGVKLFKTFLDQEHCSNTLDFWFACSGLKMVSATDHDRIQSLVKLIYKKYIKGDQLSLKAHIKSAIIDRIKHDLIDQTIFDSAQTDVENAMRSDTYQLFLKSDLYLQYVQNGGDSPKTGSNNSSGSNSVRPMSGPLPTLVEDKELDQSDFKKPDPPSNMSLSLTTSALMSTASNRYRQSLCNNSSIRKSEGAFPAAVGSSRGPAYPYHVSYAPVSAQDSELQSLSSDALTDDTMSLTDSSVDGRDVSSYGFSKSAYRKHQKHVRRYAENNRATDLNQTLIPRTERAPKDRNLAEKDPAKFAKMLTERLQEVKDAQDKLERVRQLNLETDSETEGVAQSGPVKGGGGGGGQQSNNTSITELIRGAQPDMIASMLKEQGKEEEGDEAQSILEAHVSRIWDSSNGQTPSRSPGRHSPKSMSPDRSLRRGGGFTHPTPNVSGSGNSLLFTPNPKTHRRSKKDNMFMFNTSGVEAGAVPAEDRTSFAVDYGVTKHVYHHHHHHHHVNKDKRHVMEDTSNRGMNYYVSAPHMHTDTHGVGLLEEPSGRGKRSNKKASDSSSNIDSGVGLHYDANKHPQVPNSHDPNYNKVVSWMLGNEKTLSGNTQYSTDGSDKGSSQKRASSHKSQSSQNKSSTSSSHGGHGSSKKQPVQYNVSRTGTLEHPGMHSFGPAEYSFTQPAAGVQPSQPMAQDPSMPLLPSPNPTTQLEEVKRRLVEEQKSSSKQRNSMLKSESFTGSSSLNSKDKGRMPPPAVPPRPPRNIPPTAPMDLSFSEDHSSSSTKSDKRQQKKASSVPSTPQTADETVVGYFFCGEPIPYRTTIPGRNITLAQFKQVISKKGNYRYFFKTVSDEFDSGMVLMEVTEDGSVLPLWEGKIVGKVEKVE